LYQGTGKYFLFNYKKTTTTHRFQTSNTYNTRCFSYRKKQHHQLYCQ